MIGVLRRVAVAMAIASFVLGGALAPMPQAMAADGLHFEILDPPVYDDPKNWGGDWTVGNGQIGLILYGGRYRAGFGWTFDPSAGAAGLDLNLFVSGSVICGPMSVSTSVSSSDFTFVDDIRGVEAQTTSEGTPPDCPEKLTKNSGVIHAVPNAGSYAVGDKLELHVGAAYGPGVRYTFTVTQAGSSDGRGGSAQVGDDITVTGDGKGSLNAILDCPDSIVIGEHPGLQCALDISGYQRNTAAPVVVTSPSEVDGYGNTISGIQLSVLTGEADPSNWDASQHWPFSPYACAPGSPGSGANCYDNFTTPGTKVIPIVVSQQGVGEVRLNWIVRAVPGAVRTSGFAGNWTTSYGDMVIAVNGTDATGTYTLSGGLLYGRVDGPVFSGTWAQPDGAGRTCETAFQGSKAWGRFVFTLGADGNSFTGTWGYCNDPATSGGWDGARP